METNNVLLEKILPELLSEFNSILKKHGVEDLEVVRFMLDNPTDPDFENRQIKIEEQFSKIFKDSDSSDSIKGCGRCCSRSTGRCYTCCIG